MAKIDRYTAVVSVVGVMMLGFFSSATQSLRFDLTSGKNKCIAEDIKANAMTVGKYTAVNPKEGYPFPYSHKISVRVTSSSERTYHLSDHVEAGQFAFTTEEAGDYLACFWMANHEPVSVTVDFDWKSGVAAKDWSSVAKKGSVDVMEIELKKLYDTASSIHQEMFYLREREEEMQELNRSTNFNMALFSFLSLLICLSVAGLELWHLKKFFEKKKLI